MESKQFQRLFFDARDYPIAEPLPLPEHLKPPPPHRRSRKEIREARERMRRRYLYIFPEESDSDSFESGSSGRAELPPLPASSAPLGLTPLGKPRKKRKPNLFHLISDVPCTDEYDNSPQHREAMRIIYEERCVAVQRSWTENKEAKRNNYPVIPIVFGFTHLNDQ